MNNWYRRTLVGLGILFVTFFCISIALIKPKYKYQFNPQPSELTYNLSNGERVFNASGCGSCHLDPNGSTPSLILAGGHALKTDFGTFYSPNISPHKIYGIGSWTLKNFSDAVRNGISPNKNHYFPSFPYNSYQGMSDEDLVDLYQFLMSLSPSEKRNKPHDLHFPFVLRELVGFWKHLYFYSVQNDYSKEPEGKYLVEALGHCAECHTPRTILGGLNNKRSLAGAKPIKNEGAAPNITPHKTGIGNWTIDDIINYLDTGFTPDFDSAGGHMVAVITNLSKLPKKDLVEIAKYIKSIKPVASN